MESDMMKVVYSSIINGMNRELSPNEIQCNAFKAVIAHKESFMTEIQLSQPMVQSDDLDEKSSLEVFTSLVNASNCANFQTERVLNGYLTFAPESALIREYCY